VVMGAVGYMSPEQITRRERRPPFGPVQLRRPPELPASVPLALNRIVRRCLEKEPDRRFQSAADLGFALESLSVTPARDANNGDGSDHQRWPAEGLAPAHRRVAGVFQFRRRRQFPVHRQFRCS
jgi:hypothetical protein